MAAAIIISLLVILFVGVPVAIALAAIGMMGTAYVVSPEAMMGMLRTIPFDVTRSYELITIPMFVLMAEYVMLSGTADKLFSSMSIWLGRVRGGLAMATALAGAGFGAVSGSSTAAAAALSSTSIPAMTRAGYEGRFSCGVVGVSGTLAMLIPPSLALILYGIITEESVGRLLIAGIIPGIVVLLVIFATIQVLLWRKPELAPPSQSYSWSKKFSSLRGIWPMLLLIFLVTGLIYLGIATPTEAASIGSFGAFILTIATGKLNRRTFIEALERAVRTTCMIFLIIIGAKIFGIVLTLTQVTQGLVSLASQLETSPYLVLAIIIAIYILLGCVMDQVATLILTVPITVPVIEALGFDPIWFGVIVVVTAEIGMITPPVGLNAFVVSRVANRPLLDVFAGLWPHVLAHLVVIVLLCVFPQLVLWLPGTSLAK